MNETGMIHLYYGDGKGKTTAAIGLAIRAAGCGFDVVFLQFMKSWDSGELAVFKNIPNINLVRSRKFDGFSWDWTSQQKEQIKKWNEDLFFDAINSKDLLDGCPRMIVFDELLNAIDKDLIDSNAVMDFLKNKPEALEVVLTGRKISDELLEIADYASEIRNVKHPYERGIIGRKGIEY
ncbi:MAG: cob(I)yrinic acid a,c-diamide adenosyltransferase [Saccharofermentanales bacterium]